jgi:polyvinyl alcohol dehydrogenase (cytochrome)
MSSITKSRRPTQLSPRIRTIALVALVFAAASGALAWDHATPSWRMIGHGARDNRTQPFERRIGVESAHRLTVKWIASTAGDVSATPAVADGAVYFGDFGGMEWKLSAATGDVFWSHKISDYTGIGGDISRTSPTLAGDTLVIGDLSAPNILGIDAKSGDLRWITKLDPDPHAIITGSPVLADDTIFVGTSQAGTTTYPGALVALDPHTGKILWRDYSLPNPDGLPGGYWGAVMFGPPAVDVRDHLVFATFKVAQGEPPAVKACNAAAPGGFSEACEEPGSLLSSIVAFDMKTGTVKWSYRVVGPKPWQRACGSQPSSVTWCAAESDNPLNAGDKWDFGGSGPNVFDIGRGRDRHRVVGVGEKSGVYLVLDAKTGDFVWNTLVGPGGDMGGIEWGTAYDGDRIYVSITNQHHISYLMTDRGKLTSTSATGGSWAALDPEGGKILWQRPDPQTEVVSGNTVGVWDLAPVSAANGVAYVASMAKGGNEFYALDGATGEILWDWPAGSSVNAAPAIVGGSVYWGSGYARAGAVEGSGNNMFFAFTLERRDDGDSGSSK